MSLIIYNTTGSDIEIDDLGITVPATNTYDLTSRSQTVIARSQQLQDYVTNSVIEVVNDPVAPTYWTANEGLILLQYGVNRTAIGLGDTTGFTNIANGTTADRPNVPDGGMTRYNSDTGFVEMYQQGVWHNMPLLSNSVVSMVDGARGPVLSFTDPVTSKSLSVAITTTDFSSGNTQNKTWLQVHQSFVGASIGFRAAYDLTISVARGYSDMQIAKNISLFIDDVEYANALVWDGTEAPGTNIVSSVHSIDATTGQLIRFRVFSGSSGSLGAVALTVFYQLKG
jgi:hypothetical protein